MRRREFLGVLGAAALPVVARANPAMPVIGFLDNRSPDAMTDRLLAFRQGLKESGYVEGETSRLNTVGKKITCSGCQNWRPTWLADALQ
jgi:hypothetical protein